METLEQKYIKMEKALKRIEKWVGEFPETGKFWDNEKKEPMSYIAAFGSNGERDFMRALAKKGKRQKNRIFPRAKKYVKLKP